MTSQLISKIRTIDERDKLSSEVNLLLNSIYKEKGTGFESSLKSQVRMWVAEIMRAECTPDILTDLSKIENYLKGILSKIESFQVMTLTVAFEPTESSIDKFTKLIRDSGAENIILEFSFDPSVLGGAIVSNKGEYRDLSLKRLYEAEYKVKEEEVLKIMYST